MPVCSDAERFLMNESEANLHGRASRVRLSQYAIIRKYASKSNHVRPVLSHELTKNAPEVRARCFLKEVRASLKYKAPPG